MVENIPRQHGDLNRGPSSRDSSHVRAISRFGVPDSPSRKTRLEPSRRSRPPPVRNKNLRRVACSHCSRTRWLQVVHPRQKKVSQTHLQAMSCPCNDVSPADKNPIPTHALCLPQSEIAFASHTGANTDSSARRTRRVRCLTVRQSRYSQHTAEEDPPSSNSRR